MSGGPKPWPFFSLGQRRVVLSGLLDGAVGVGVGEDIVVAYCRCEQETVLLRGEEG